MTVKGFMSCSSEAKRLYEEVNSCQPKPTKNKKPIQNQSLIRV
jgi:hypothetical protein